MKKLLHYFLLLLIAIVFYNCSATHHVEKKTVVKKENVERTTTAKPQSLPIASPSTIKKNNAENKSHLSEREYEKYLVQHYAGILDVPNSYIKRNIELYKFVDIWLGTPYQYAGNSQSGIDCSGFAKALYDEVFHLSLTRDGGSQYKQCNPINKDDLQEGDLLFFKIGSRSISHVAIYLGNNKFVHASSGKGVMISDLNEKYYKKYYFSAGRLK